MIIDEQIRKINNIKHKIIYIIDHYLNKSNILFCAGMCKVFMRECALNSKYAVYFM